MKIYILNDIVEKSEKHMNIGWNQYGYFGGDDNTEEDKKEEYNLAMKTFCNEWSISDVGTIYGVEFGSCGHDTGVHKWIRL